MRPVYIALFALTLLVTKPAEPKCYWRELEQGATPGNKWVLVCEGPPPKIAPPK
jgi:hypothetical protein